MNGYPASPKFYLAPFRTICAKDTPKNLRPARAYQPKEPQDFATIEIEAHISKMRLALLSSHLQHFLAPLWPPDRVHLANTAPDHFGNQGVLVSLGNSRRADKFPVFQNGYAVTDSKD